MRATGFEFMESHYRKILEENERLLNALIASQRKRDELGAENKQLRAKLFPYADATEISGISFDGKYLIGDKKSITYFHEMQNRGLQIDVYRRAFDERIAAAEAAARATLSDKGDE